MTSGMDVHRETGKWNIFGEIAPDTTYAYKASNDKEYLVIANEGDDKVSTFANHVEFRKTLYITRNLSDISPSSRNSFGIILRRCL